MGLRLLNSRWPICVIFKSGIIVKLKLFSIIFLICALLDTLLYNISTTILSLLLQLYLTFFCPNIDLISFREAVLFLVARPLTLLLMVVGVDSIQVFKELHIRKKPCKFLILAISYRSKKNPKNLV